MVILLWICLNNPNYNSIKQYIVYCSNEFNQYKLDSIRNNGFNDERVDYQMIFQRSYLTHMEYYENVWHYLSDRVKSFLFNSHQIEVAHQSSISNCFIIYYAFFYTLVLTIYCPISVKRIKQSICNFNKYTQSTN